MTLAVGTIEAQRVTTLAEDHFLDFVIDGGANRNFLIGYCGGSFSGYFASLSIRIDHGGPDQVNMVPILGDGQDFQSIWYHLHDGNGLPAAGTYSLRFRDMVGLGGHTFAAVSINLTDAAQKTPDNAILGAAGSGSLISNPFTTVENGSLVGSLAMLTGTGRTWTHYPEHTAEIMDLRAGALSASSTATYELREQASTVTVSHQASASGTRRWSVLEIEDIDPPAGAAAGGAAMMAL